MIIRKNLNSICVVICMAVLGLAGLTQATTYFVSPGQSIQAAIDAAEDSDEIEVAPGTYNEAIDFKGKAVRLYSSGGPDVTTIDATGLSSSVVICTSSEGPNTVLTGFTITGGTGTPDSYGQLCGGGMRNESSSPTVTSCIFTSNSAEFGGGLFNYAGSATLSDCTFTNNTVSHWGAGLYNNDSSPTLTNCIFSGNTATEFGGGIYNGNTSNPSVSDCNFTDNSAREGGGMHNGSSSSPTVSDCSFSNNTADWGGGMYNHTSNPTVVKCTFNGNNAVTATDDGRGGGMFNNWYSSPLVTECIFISNSSDDYGGGMYNYDYSSPTVTNCTFRGNTATVVGGGIANANNSSPTVINGTFSGNTAAYGAGMHGNFSSSPTMTNCAFSGNTAGTDGGGMYNTNSSSPTLTNCTLIGNTAGDSGGAIFSYNGSPTVTNCILWGNTPDELYDMGGVPIVTYSDVEGGYGGTGNINTDPCFVNAAGGDLRLLYDSSCIDAGDNSTPYLTATDLAGNGRLFDGDGDGNTIVDMGAYEFGSLKLLAHWKLDESSGDTAYDSSGYNHGTLEPAPTPPLWQPAGGWFSGALLFDGVDDYVFIPNESKFDITNEITVSAWIKVTAFDKVWQAIVTKGDRAWRLQRLRDTNSIAFHCNAYWGADGSIDVNDGQWHHVAGVYDGTQAYLYVDGELDNSVPAFGLIWTNNYPVMIGKNAERPGRCWNGLIDDVRIYTCGLSPSEVYHLYYGKIYYVDTDAAGKNNGSSWSDAFNHLQDALESQATSGWEIRVAEGTYKPDANSSNPSGTGDRTASFPLINGVNLKGGYAGFGQPDPHARDCDLYKTTLSGDINTPGDANDNSYHVVTSSDCDPNTVLEGFTITGGNANGTSPNDLGGGMYNFNSSPTVTNCRFSGNTSEIDGGGMYNGTSSPTVTNCTFTGNTAKDDGGGMANDSSSPTVTNCIFHGNKAEGDAYNAGGGMYNYNNSDPTLTNCTFYDNSADSDGGGGIYNYDNQTVTNCILWGNANGQIAGNWGTVNYSCLQGTLPAGTGNIDADPCFVDTAGGNLRLRPGSPCIDKGSNMAVPSGITTDFDGHPRIIDGDCDEIDVVDMGAYEFALAYLGDFDNNCSVDFFDVSILAQAWETEEGDPDWNWICDISYPPDNYINWRDVAVLCDNWLAGNEPEL